MMLDVNNINVFFRDIQVIRGVSINLEKNEVICLLGSNGAGKTTLVNTICGIVRSKDGTITFEGEQISRQPAYQIARKGITLVPQGRRLFSDQSVINNLSLGAYSHIGRRDYEKNLELVYAMFPILKNRIRQTVGTLSGGEQQMLAIGRAIMSSPKVMILDEPSLGLAPIMIDIIFEKIKELYENGIAIIVVEQMIWKSFEVASRGYILNLGKVVIQGSVEALSFNPAVREAYISA